MNKKSVQISVCFSPSSGIDHEQNGTVSQTIVPLLVLQVLLALVALACVVLAEPQNVEVNRPVGRLRIPGRGRFGRPYNPTEVTGSNRQRVRPTGPVSRPPALTQPVAPGAVPQPANSAAAPPAVAPPAAAAPVPAVPVAAG